MTNDANEREGVAPHTRAHVLAGNAAFDDQPNLGARHQRKARVGVLALTIPEPAAGRFVWPANRTDGTSTSPTAIPEGTRFRLDPKLNVAALGLPPMGAAIALAAQRYGMIVRDRGGGVVLYAEDPRPLRDVVPAGLRPAKRRDDRVLYQNKVANFMKQSLDVTAQTVLSGDRRSLRFTMTPQFTEGSTGGTGPVATSSVIPGGKP